MSPECSGILPYNILNSRSSLDNLFFFKISGLYSLLDKFDRLLGLSFLLECRLPGRQILRLDYFLNNLSPFQMLALFMGKSEELRSDLKKLRV